MSISEMRKALAKIAGVLAVLADMKVYANNTGISFTIAKRATADYPLLVKDVGDNLVEAVVPAIDEFEANLAETEERKKEEAAKAKAAEIKQAKEEADNAEPAKKPATKRRTRRAAKK